MPKKIIAEGPPSDCELLSRRARNLMNLLENSLNRRSAKNIEVKLCGSLQAPFSTDSPGPLTMEESNTYHKNVFLNANKKCMTTKT